MSFEKIKYRTGVNLAALSVLLSIEDISGSVFSVLRVASHRRSIKNLKAVKKAFDAIDDHIDNEQPENLIKLDTSCVDNKASEFTEHVLNILKEKPQTSNIKRFFSLLENKDKLSDDLINFGNLLSKEVKKELTAKIENDRSRAVEYHLEITGIQGGLFSHMIKFYNDRSIDTSELSPEKIKKSYPNSYLFARNIQIADDINDVLIDNKHEKTTGILSSNYFINELVKKDIRPELDEFSRQIPGRFNINKKLHEQIGIIRREIKESIKSLPHLSKLSFMTAFDNFINIYPRTEINK